MKLWLDPKGKSEETIVLPFATLQGDVAISMPNIKYRSLFGSDYVFRIVDPDSNLKVQSTINKISLRMTIKETDFESQGRFFKIVDVNTTTGTFKILGDQTHIFFVGKIFRVVNSTGNDEVYTVDSVTIDLGDTVVGVTGSIPSAIVDGEIIANEPGNKALDLLLDHIGRNTPVIIQVPSIRMQTNDLVYYGIWDSDTLSALPFGGMRMLPSSSSALTFDILVLADGIIDYRDISVNNSPPSLLPSRYRDYPFTGLPIPPYVYVDQYDRQFRTTDPTGGTLLTNGVIWRHREGNHAV